MLKVAIDAQLPEHTLYAYMRSGRPSNHFRWVAADDLPDVTILALENDRSQERIDAYQQSGRPYFLYFESLFWLTKYCTPEFIRSITPVGIISHTAKTCGEVLELVAAGGPETTVYQLPVGVPTRPVRPIFDRLSRLETRPLTLLFWGSHNDLTNAEWENRGGPLADELFCALRRRGPCELIVRAPAGAMRAERDHSHSVMRIDSYLDAEDLEHLHARADVFLLPSTKAHFISVPYAMSFGMPTVGLRHWALEELLVDGQNGIIAADAEDMLRRFPDRDKLLSLSLGALATQRNRHNAARYPEGWERIFQAVGSLEKKS
jgi:hypothetical protein